jgi:hypothetical protein
MALDSVGQRDFVQAFPIDKWVSVNDVVTATGIVYDTARPRCNRYAKLGYIESKLDNTTGRAGGRNILLYRLTAENKITMLGRIASHGSLSPVAQKRGQKACATIDKIEADRKEVLNWKIFYKVLGAI